MNLVDLVILIYLVPFVVFGYRDGFLKKTLGFAAFVVGFVVAVRSMARVGNWIYHGLHLPKEMSIAVGFFIVVFIFVGLENLIYLWIKSRAIHDTPKFWSRVIGAIVGGIEGTIAASLVLILLLIVEYPPQKMQEESLLYRPLVEIAPTVFDYSMMWAPDTEDFYDQLKRHFQHLHIP